MKGFLFAAALAALSIVAATLTGRAEAALIYACPPSSPIVVNVTETVTNDLAAGLDGHPWALQAYTRQIVVFKTGPRTYCAITNTRGTFGTLAALSPAGTGTVSSGITGIFSAGLGSTNFTAKWRPLAPTSGSLGNFDFRCSLATGCPGALDWLGLYFEDVQGYAITTVAQWYLTTANGTWKLRSDLGSSGDILG